MLPFPGRLLLRQLQYVVVVCPGQAFVRRHHNGTNALVRLFQTVCLLKVRMFQLRNMAQDPADGVLECKKIWLRIRQNLFGPLHF